MKKILIIILFSNLLVAQNTPETQKKWVDSVYQSLSLPEKVGQLFMVAAYSNKDEAHIKTVEKLVTEQKVGGLIFFQGGPVRQANLTNLFQSKAKTPLFIGIDAEWGLAMRLDSTYRYPYNMTLGAVSDLKLIEKFGQQIGKQAKRLGIHFTFAPVIDINTNPNNPIIGIRSFGENKENVTEKALAYMKGLQQENVWATAKHFPGHGDTSADSHHTLPFVNFEKKRFIETEWYPYKQLINKGLASVMVAHLEVPKLEKKKNTPSSVSYKVITEILKQELNFKGLIFTDALNMKAASEYKKNGILELEAFEAGNDLLLFSENVEIAIQKLVEQIKKGKITEKRLEESVKKILNYKYKANLNSYKPIEINNLYQDLNLPENEILSEEIYKNAITVVKNKHKNIPIHTLEKEKFAYIRIGEGENKPFVDNLKKYIEITEIKETNIDTIIQKLNNFTKVIISYHKTDHAWKSHKLLDTEVALIDKIAPNNKTIFVSFAKAYALQNLKNTNDLEGLIMAYQNHPMAQKTAAEIIFGTAETQSKLPVTINDDLEANSGYKTHLLKRLGFDKPENVGINPEILTKIDSIATDAINRKITPGMQVLVARKAKVVYQKAFGKHTFDAQSKTVETTDVYDLASLTKILATLPLTMQLYDDNAFDLDTKLKEILPEFKKSNKADIQMKDLLSHQAQLQAWEPFYQKTLDANKKPSEKYYKAEFSTEFSIPVAKNLYLRTDYKDTIFQAIIDSKLLQKKQYKYSDFAFIILKKYIEKELDNSLDNLAYERFYKKIGANSLVFNPLTKMDSTKIIPTEVDSYFRHQELKGSVHDMTAAMFGGISGHAGLFGNSLDVAKIMQLFLNKGVYGDTEFFTSKTFDIFNTCHFCEENNRRGLGFDKPQLSDEGPTCGCTTKSSFGHTGFTGTMAWADPEKELIYIFLSNRTYPDGNTNKLSKENIREKIQKIIYDSLVD